MDKFASSTEEDKQCKAAIKKLFIKLAGEDGEIDAYELKDILNTTFPTTGQCQSGWMIQNSHIAWLQDCPNIPTNDLETVWSLEVWGSHFKEQKLRKSMYQDSRTRELVRLMNARKNGMNTES